MTSKQTVSTTVKDWVSLSRPPFHTVGILPFCLGTLLALRFDNVFRMDVFILGTAAVILIMLSTYHAGEYFDIREDTISKRIFPSRFAGGSGVMPAGRISGKVPFRTSIATFIAAGAIGILLQFYYKTGPYTFFLGVLGAIPGFFYSTRPVRLVGTGFGECFIGFCYGWLPVAASFYIQTAYIHPLISWLSIPIAASIFNVILVNEFPDYEGDRESRKLNLLVRFGKPCGKMIYSCLTFLSWIAFLLSVRAGVAPAALCLYIPVMLLSLIAVWMLASNMDTDRKKLEAICGLTIIVNLGTTASYILAFW
ncbi:MAG: prenyltransferase [Syntrophaceae bacterium]